MKDTDHKSWIEKLEVTGPIKGIMDFVDELSINYDKRIAAMHADYQKDIEEILACYKEEKHEFYTLLAQQKSTIEELQSELKALQQRYKILSVEHKLTADSLEGSKEELKALTQAMKSEEEFIALAKERIQVAQQQIGLEENDYIPLELDQKIELPDGEIIVVPKDQKRPRFSKTREFIKQIITDRLTRPIILRPKTELASINIEEAEDQDTFSY